MAVERGKAHEITPHPQSLSDAGVSSRLPSKPQQIYKPESENEQDHTGGEALSTSNFGSPGDFRRLSTAARKVKPRDGLFRYNIVVYRRGVLSTLHNNTCCMDF